MKLTTKRRVTTPPLYDAVVTKGEGALVRELYHPYTDIPDL